jgi:hypothetical protein
MAAGVRPSWPASALAVHGPFAKMVWITRSLVRSSCASVKASGSSALAEGRSWVADTYFTTPLWR